MIYFMYIDPGTGMIIIQAIIAAIASIGIFFGKIKNFILKFLRKKK